ncbi:MAG: hypothetical protein HDR43_02360 [Mycoplasma sp.]|nr:hypothetical protein [Mycoplasma sp.]
MIKKIEKEIKNVSELSFLNIDYIEKEIFNIDKENEIDNLIKNDKFQNEYNNKIFNHLKIEESWYGDEDWKSSLDNLLKEIQYKLINSKNDNKDRYWNFSEMIMPLKISEKYKDINWIYYNQFYKFDEPGNTQRGMDCIFLYKDTSLIFSEIKSTQNKNSIYSQTMDAQKELTNWTFNYDKLKKLLVDLKSWLSKDTKEIIKKISSENQKFLLIFLNIRNSNEEWDTRNKIHVLEHFEKKSFSIVEGRMINNVLKKE